MTINGKSHFKVSRRMRRKLRATKCYEFLNNFGHIVRLSFAERIAITCRNNQMVFVILFDFDAIRHGHHWSTFISHTILIKRNCVWYWKCSVTPKFWTCYRRHKPRMQSTMCDVDFFSFFFATSPRATHTHTNCNSVSILFWKIDSMENCMQFVSGVKM